MAKKKMTEARRALLERAHVNAERTRKLAEKALADLEHSKRRRRSA
jgi:hypothetical protein